MTRGRYFTLPQAVEAYPGVLTERLLRRLVAERRVAFTYCGRRLVFAEADLEAYLDARRVEPFVARRERTPVATGVRLTALSSTSALAGKRGHREPT